MSLPHKDKFGDREIIHHWLLANEDSTTSKGLALDQVPDSDGPSRIHDWLEKEASGPETKSLVSRLCEECIKAARNALRDMKTRGNLPKIEYRSLERSTSSFVLWVDGHKVAEGQLDDALGKSRMLRLSVLKLLISISNTLCDKLVPRLVTHPRTQLLEDLTLQAKADFLNTCGDSDSEYSEDSGSGNSVFDLSSDLVSIDWKEIADDMQTDVECLIDLGPLIESPFIDPMETKSVDSSTRNLKLDTGCQVYSNRIGHRFSEAQQDLVDRLAIANWNRLLRVLEEKEKALTENEAVVVPAANDEVVASEKGTTFHDSGLGTSVPTASAYAETVMSYRKGNHSQAQIPPMPQEGKKHNPFECLVCGRQVTMASDSAWKTHVYNDLRPWVCHQIPCRYGVESFHSQEDWIQHLASEHDFKDKWDSFKCPLCLEDTGNGKTKLTKHLANHLEEISLSALPANVEPDGESIAETDIAISPKLQNGAIQSHPDSESSLKLIPTIKPSEAPTEAAHDSKEINGDPSLFYPPRLDETYSISDAGKVQPQNIIEANFNLQDRHSHSQSRLPDTLTSGVSGLCQSLDLPSSKHSLDIDPSISKEDINSTLWPELHPKSPKPEDAKSLGTTNMTCPVCSSFIGNVTLLRKHIKCHERPHECTANGCTRKFAYAKDLKRHMYSHHTTLIPLSCTFCSKVIHSGRKDNLIRHMRSHHRSVTVSAGLASDVDGLKPETTRDQVCSNGEPRDPHQKTTVDQCVESS